jgi:hypothetical protein
MDRTAKVSYLSLIVIVGFAGSVGYHYVQGVYFGRPYPQNTFLFDPAVHGSDFQDVLHDGHTLNPYLQYSSAQYPLLALIGFVLSLIPKYADVAFLVIVSMGFMMLSMASLRLANWWSSATHVLVIAFLSYPFLFAIDRANFELLVFVLLLAFLHFFTRGQHGWGALCLGLAIALKLYPVVLLVLYIPAKNVRAMFLGLSVAAAATLGSLLCFEGGLWANASFLLQAGNIQSNPAFLEFTSFSSNMVQRGVSLLTFLKVISIETGFIRGMAGALFMSRYLISSAVVGAVALAYSVLVEKDLWRRVAVLVLAMLLLPPISADYKLLLVYLPLYLFINSDRPSRLDPAFLAVFGALLVPKSYYYLPTVISDALPRVHDISIAVPANVVLLLLLGLLIVIPGLLGRFRQPRKSPAPIEVESMGE